MRRVIYCPNESFLEKASDLSKQNFLPIQVGESAITEKLDFDRHSLCVISIPQYNQVAFKDSVSLGFHQIINYSNDYVIFNESLFVLINDEKIQPVLMEKHYAKFAIQCDSLGTFAFHIQHDNKTLESLQFNVN